MGYGPKGSEQKAKSTSVNISVPVVLQLCHISSYASATASHRFEDNVK